MEKAKTGDSVEVHYKGTLEDGSVFDTSEGREPLKVVLGENRLLKDFEDAVLGMAIGEKKRVVIEAEDAYGEVRSDLVIRVDLANLPENIDPEVGMEFKLKSPEGQEFIVAITAIDDQSVTLDANHPLAGKQLTFDIELAKIN